MTWRTSPSRQRLKAHAAGMDFMANKNPQALETLKTMQAKQTTRSKTPRKQAESKVNDAIIKAGRLFGAVLFRNRRGMVRLEGGGMFPYGLGSNGFPDNAGYTPIKITPEMVGKTVAVFTAIEAKTDTGRVAPHQQACIDELKAHGCIAGVATSGEDVRGIIREWESR